MKNRKEITPRTFNKEKERIQNTKLVDKIVGCLVASTEKESNVTERGLNNATINKLVVLLTGRPIQIVRQLREHPERPRVRPQRYYRHCPARCIQGI